MKDIHTFVILAYNESDDLEDCIKSVLNQSVKSNCIIATSTSNNYILDLASNYGLGIMINDSLSNKGSDYNYAINTFDTELITIAHQDDIYDRNYAREVLECYKNNKDATIIFTNYYEINNDKKIMHSKELFKKRFFIKLLQYPIFQNKKFFKLNSLRFINSICTSSVTFVKKNINGDIFPTNIKYYNDWDGFLELSKKKSKFVYLNKKLVGYRLIKNDDKSHKIEKINIYKKMWPNFIINILYKESLKNEKN